MATTIPARDARASRRFLRFDRRRGLIGLVTFLVFLVGWQLYAENSGNVFDLPTPTSTWAAFVEMLRSGELWQATKESGAVFLAGTIPGIAIGIAMGIVIGGIRPLDIAFSPYIFAFYSTPFVALIPLFLLLFGVGFVGKVAIVFTLVWLAVVIQTIPGVRDVDPRFLEVAHSFGSSAWRTLIEVRFPAAMSLIVAGIRLAVGRALVGVVIAEFDTAFSGLGAEIFRHSQRFRLSHALVPAVVLAITGIVLTAVLRRAEGHVERWRHVD